MENTFVINIGRQIGSGGKEIGQVLAKNLNIKCYDKELLLQAAEDSGLSPESFLKKDERKASCRSFFSNFIPFIGTGDIYGNPIGEEALFRIQSETIRRISERESCIFIGRCADYVLREKRQCVNVFVSADSSDREKRICERMGVSLEEARRLISHGDAGRANFYNFYSGGTWGAADTYHLCINSSPLGLEETERLIRHFALRKLGITTE